MPHAIERENATLRLPGPLAGVGIDVLVRGRVSTRLAERRFSGDEQRIFAEARDIPFAAREAVLKAVGGPGILGAPLREMPVAWDGGALVFRPGPKYQAVLDERNVQGVRLIHVAARDDHVIVVGLAWRSGDETAVRVAWALVPLALADEGKLTSEEVAFARTRPHPPASIGTRHAARLAAESLGLTFARVTGGGDDPPRLDGAPGVHVSLGHEDELAVAALAVESRLTCADDCTTCTVVAAPAARERDGPIVAVRRSMTSSVNVFVDGPPLSVPAGTRVGDVVPREVDGSRVVAALVDYRITGLSALLSHDAAVVPLPLSHWEGERVVRRSLGLALLRAGARLSPPLGLRLGGSIGLGQRVHVEATSVPLDVLLESLRASLRAVIAEREPFRTEQWPTEDAMRLLSRTGDRDAAKVVGMSLSDTVPLLVCGETRALGTGPVLPDAGWLSDCSLARQRATDMSEVHERWLRSMDITSVGRLAERCIEGKVSEVIDVSEGFHEKRIGEIASEIQRRGTVRAITVAGPSSSGKTTFLRRLRVQLSVVGVHSHLISLDDYYVDRARTPRDEVGEYDYETFEALDVPLLHGHVAQILDGKPVKTARYDFTTGLSNRHGGPEITLAPSAVLLVEGIHGLHPQLFPSVAEDSIFRVFVNPSTTLPIDRLTTVSASDLRLIRRIVRDRFQRGTTPADNIRRWPSVRRGEKRHIFPHLGLADAVFDSALVYEPAVLKVYAERYLLEVPRSDPTHATAHRLRGLLDAFVAIYPDHVPRTSLLREFIGGGDETT